MEKLRRGSQEAYHKAFHHSNRNFGPSYGVLGQGNQNLYALLITALYWEHNVTLNESRPISWSWAISRQLSATWHCPLSDERRKDGALSLKFKDNKMIQTSHEPVALSGKPLPTGPIAAEEIDRGRVGICHSRTAMNIFLVLSVICAAGSLVETLCDAVTDNQRLGSSWPLTFGTLSSCTSISSCATVVACSRPDGPSLEASPCTRSRFLAPRSSATAPRSMRHMVSSIQLLFLTSRRIAHRHLVQGV